MPMFCVPDRNARYSHKLTTSLIVHNHAVQGEHHVTATAASAGDDPTDHRPIEHKTPAFDHAPGR